MSEDNPSYYCTLYSTADLARFLAGDLSPRRQRHMQQHLSFCSSCRERIHELSSVRAMLKSTPDVALPRSFTLSAQDIRRRRRTLWYPVLRSATTAAATLVLLLLLGGLLQPSLLGGGAPAPRVIGAKPTPLVAPTPLPVAVAPASTWRPRPTQAAAGQAPSAMPTVGISGIGSLPAYPQPVDSGPRIHATVSRPAVPATAVKTEPRTAALWPVIHLGGLLLLGALAGLTWLAYRRERAFFS